MDLALDNLQWLIYHKNKTKQNQIKLLQSRVKVTRDIGLCVNANKCVYFKRQGAMSTLNGGTPKLADFSYLGSRVSSTKSDVKIYLAKVRTAID